MSSDQRLTFESMSSMVQPGQITLERVRGEEALSEPYRYELTWRVDDDGGLADEVLDDLLRMPCRVLVGQDEEMAELSGILSAIEMESTREPRPVFYRATLVPKLWMASQIQRSRIFQDLDVMGVARAVLGELGLEEDTHFEVRTEATYPVSEYVVQYQESDLDFLHRLLEHHGVFYFFAQEPDGERVVFGDSNHAFSPLEGYETLPYVAGDATQSTGLLELHRTLTPQPAAVLLRDYNWRTPSVGLQSQAPVDATTGRGFVNRYGEHFKTPAEGDTLARLRAQQLQSRRDRYRARARVARLAPGHRFALSGHPIGDLDREYLVTRTRQDFGELGAQADGSLGHAKELDAIPFDAAFRPALRTPRPKIEGIMHARVDGEVPGTAAPIDEYGRYKILFPFDLAAQPGGKASRWVRLAQPASGAGYGIHFPLHIGAEVAVAHIDGDPDRPIIMNSPPNAETVTPVSQTNATQSQIITQTGIRLTWDDDCPAGAE